MVKFIKSPTPLGYANFPGEIAEYSEAEESKLISEGYAIQHFEAPKTDAPEANAEGSEAPKTDAPEANAEGSEAPKTDSGTNDSKSETKENRKDKTEKETR